MVELIGLGKGFDAKQEDYWEFKVEDELHLKNFYRSLYEYIKDNEYVSLWGDDKFETYYDEKFHSNNKREYRIRWRIYYPIPGQTHVIIKYNINWLILGMKDKETVINGKKMKIQRGEVEIKCFTNVLVNKEILKGKILSPFKRLFFDRWFKYLYEGYKDEAKSRSKAIEEKIKLLLGMRTYGDYGTEFHRNKGFNNPHQQNK